MKTIKFAILLIISFISINVHARNVEVYFSAEGGIANSTDFKIVDDYVQKSDGTYCAKYDSAGSIQKINTINSYSFSLSKSGTGLVKGREWYVYNYDNNKLYFFDQSKTYSVDSILQILGMQSDPYPVITLFAHWKNDPLEGGTDMYSTGNSSQSNNSGPILISISSIYIEEGKTQKASINYIKSTVINEKITWTSSNSKIATIDTNGTIKGIKEGTVNITATLTGGAKATKKIYILKKGTHSVIIQYHENGGYLAKQRSKDIYSSNHYITYKGSKKVQTIPYNTSTSEYGLIDSNNTTFLNIKKWGYTAKQGAEWNTKPNGSGKSYSQKQVYKSSDFCDASKKDCTVTLYVNWERKNYVNIQYNANGGKLASNHGKNVSATGNIIYCHKKKNCTRLFKGESLTKDGLANYNNPAGINIKRDGYTVTPGAEWNTKPDGTGKSYSQTKVYKSTDFCDSSKKDCNVFLYINWKKTTSSKSNKSTTKTPSQSGQVSTKSTKDSSVESSYGVFLGLDHDSGLSKLYKYKLVVIDLQEFTKSDIEKLHNKGIKVYSYLNVGSVENYRTYYKRFKKYYLGTYENWEDEKWVDVSKSAYQNFIINELEPSLRAKGADGYFIDNCDVYANFKKDKIYKGLQTILGSIHSHNLPMLINGGDEFVSKAIKDGSYSRLFDGVNQEEVFTVINFNNHTYHTQSKSESKYYKDYLQKVKNKGLKVYLLEYGAKSSKEKEIANYCKQNGFAYYNSKSYNLD